MFIDLKIQHFLPVIVDGLEGVEVEVELPGFPPRGVLPDQVVHLEHEPLNLLPVEAGLGAQQLLVGGGGIGVQEEGGGEEVKIGEGQGDGRPEAHC